MSNKKYEAVGDIVRIFLRGNTWWANFQKERNQSRKSLKTRSKKEARRRALLLEADILEGRYQHKARPVSAESVIKAYMDYLTSEKRAKKTITKYNCVFKRVLELFKRMRHKSVLDINLRFIDRYRQERATLGRHPGTIADEAVIIRQLINFALTREMISTDPLKGLKIQDPKPTPQPWWTQEEVQQIIAASRAPQAWALQILAETGMRIGELRWLCWDDVDFERNILHVRPKDNWQPKTGDQRAIPLTPSLRKLLDVLPRKSRWVLTSLPSRKYPNGDHQISERRLLAYLKRVLKPLGLKGHLHTFRHSFISRAVITGIPEAVIRSWVGHVDSNIMRLYTHIADAQSQAAMNRLAETNDVSDSPKVSDSPDKENDR